ncbi:hypothetical protein EVAR_33193_1 [Eumeta japonica]|uniref:Uncharacterized protein n=1 Tax=Eumeta variegata TaxID=151549 RepID=A0A4C1W1A8_EUMVA|nr:hypothetical protein EVAR_33193_1 [Eumeta japonica]
MATFQLHHQTLITIEYQSTRQDESNEPKLDGVASFNYGVPMATFQLHHQTLRSALAALRPAAPERRLAPSYT